MLGLNAYVMAADPAYLTESVLSYYDIVEKIVVSFDRQKVGWLGGPIPVDECVEQLKRLDKQNKIMLLPGEFYKPDLNGVEADTNQRQVSLDAASAGADWVLQFDSDEVLADQTLFLDCLRIADQNGCSALDYPMRWIFAAVGKNHFLEQCSRLWQPIASYPGPVAVKAGVKLRLCRQTDAKSFRVDFRSRNTDPWHLKDFTVDKVISQHSPIWHFSMVRDEEQMLKKSKWSTHAKDFDWTPKLSHWLWAKRHPILATIGTPLRRRRDWQNHKILRITRIELPVACHQVQWQSIEQDNNQSSPSQLI